MNDNFNYYLIREETYVKEINLSKKRDNRNVWSIKELSSIESIYNVGNKPELMEWTESFRRSRKWLIETHSELML